MGRTVKSTWESQDFVENFKFLIDNGSTIAEAASRLGVSVDTAQRRLQRLGIWCPDRIVRPLDERLKKLKAQGRELISVADFDCFGDSDAVFAFINSAVANKRIEKVSTKVNAGLPHGNVGYRILI
ncbi:hypothetical protein PXH69_24630 [Rhodococcus qingshengii]|uniref:Uncharacterized protein n=1 Tax=Rhodococcus qingshengii TaxID=334542 RepID=A0AAW6LUR6_RHOSG|nr:hypothetical protein [Rhodococcus qingshengii]MDE8648158.1 hypothetical protein [Rhodococcus qingshengii]